MPEAPHQDDDAGDGGTRQFEDLCLRLRSNVVAYARRRIGPRIKRWCDPEDITQQVFMELDQQIHTLKTALDDEAALAWLCRRVDWRAASAARDHGRVSGETALPDPHAITPTSVPTDGTVTRADDRRRIRELIDELPSEYAEVVRLCGLEGLSFVDAAQRLEIGADAVRKRYRKARQALERHYGSSDD